MLYGSCLFTGLMGLRAADLLILDGNPPLILLELRVWRAAI